MFYYLQVANEFYVKLSRVQFVNAGIKHNIEESDEVGIVQLALLLKY